MKRIFTLNSRLITRLFCIFIIFLSSQGMNRFLNTQASAQSNPEFEFNPGGDWEKTETNAYIVTGTHNLDLAVENYIWLFTRDRFNNLYLQNPPVELINEKNWEATNVMLSNMRYVWAIQVNREGNQDLQEMVKNQRWSAIQQSEIEGLPGYRKLASCRVNLSNQETPTPTPPQETPTPTPPQETPTPTPPTEELLIADFNSGRDPINSGGKLQQWDDGEGLIKVETRYFQLTDGDEKYGQYAAFVSLTEPQEIPEGKWAGGGLAVAFRGDEARIDLSDYQFLEFDAKIEQGSRLENTKVKLENLPGPIYVERLLSDYGVTLSTEWQAVKIPLEHFAKKRSSDPDYWVETNLTAVKNFVTVSVRDNNAPDTQGTLLIDNIRFTK